MKCEFLTFSIMIWNDIRPIGLYHFLLKKKIGKGKGEGRGGGGGVVLKPSISNTVAEYVLFL